MKTLHKIQLVNAITEKKIGANYLQQLTKINHDKIY